MIDRKDKLRFVPLDVLRTPRDGRCLINRFWCVHPEKGAAFYQVGRSSIDVVSNFSPQCNANEHIANYIHSSLWPELSVQFIPIAFEVHIVDYAEQETVTNALCAERLNVKEMGA